MVLKLMEHNLTIMYRPGVLNSNADGLSRQAWEFCDQDPSDQIVEEATSSVLEEYHQTEGENITPTHAVPSVSRQAHSSGPDLSRGICGDSLE